MPQPHKNFAYSTVATAPSPAASGTSLVVAAGEGTLFPTVPFNATIWPAGTQPTSVNAEIVTVTNVSTDTFTITRQAESTSARTVIVGDQIAATITNKTITEAESAYINLLGAATAGSTTASGTTIGWSGNNITLSGNNNSQIVISAPATSSLSATGQVSLSTNGSTISMGVAYPYVEALEPRPQTNTSAFVPGLSTWYMAPFVAPGWIGGGRINNLVVNTSTAGIAQEISSVSWVTGAGHMGTKRQGHTHLLKNALYSQGTGTNSTRLESFWSNSFSFGLTNQWTATSSGAGSTIVLSNQWSMSYIQDIGSDGAYTLSQYANAGSYTATGTRLPKANATNDASFIRAVLSNSVIYPVGFNTTISQGNYWLAQMYSTSSSSAATTVTAAGPSHMSQLNQVYVQANVLTDYRNFGSSLATARSNVFEGQGMAYTATSADPPQYIALSSDMSTVAGNNVPYFNIMQRGLTK